MICTVKGCQNAPIARGLCAMHYMRARRTGNAITVGKPGRPPIPGGHAEMVASCEPRIWICGSGFGPHKRGSETSKRIEHPRFAGDFFATSPTWQHGHSSA